MSTAVFFSIFNKRNFPFISAIKNDFSSQLHRFLASLTDTTFKMENVTMLYIPKEGSDIPVEVAAKNKELVQRLESTFFLLFNRIVSFPRTIQIRILCIKLRLYTGLGSSRTCSTRKT
jgi:hypothetical protein